MKTVAIDCRFAGGHSGIGRYTRELVSHLVQSGADFRFILIVRNEREEWIPAKRDTFTVIEADIPHYSLQEQTALRSVIKHCGADLFFSPHFNVPFFCPVPFVVTIHDLILHRYPNNAPLHKRIAYRLLISRAVRRAKAVIAISEFVAEEVRTVYGREPTVVLEGVHPSYHPVAKEKCDRVLHALGIPTPYFLYVGNAKQHKNVPSLIEAFTMLGDSSKHLVLVTGGKEAAALHPLPPGVHIVQSVSDEDLPALYTASEACLTASLYEGFCLPVVEALACGTPVIASNRTAIPEVASGRATLVEPIAHDFAEAMRVKRERVSPFVISTWEECARKTANVLKSIQ